MPSCLGRATNGASMSMSESSTMVDEDLDFHCNSIISFFQKKLTFIAKHFLK